MVIDIDALDSLKQRFTKDPNGKWYARSFLGSTLAAENEITGYASGPLPGEIQDVFATQRAAICGGGSSVVVSKSNLLTGGISIIAKLSQAQYDALPVKDESTLYFIVG